MRSSSRWGLVLSLALAAIPRAAWFATHMPDLPPDAFGYLNAARELRGRPQPDEWDDKSRFPANNKAARTAGYPVFLDLVFIAAGHSPSPDAAVARARRQHVPPAARHIEHLTTDENVRAVQAAQHLLGAAGTGFAYGILFIWTGSPLLSLAGSLVAVGWNPIWIVMFEPSLLAEVLAAFLLIVTMWGVSRDADRPIVDALISIACGVNVLVRPAMAPAVLPVLAFLVWRRRRTPWRAGTILGPAVIVVGLQVAANGMTWGYWGLSTSTGPTLFSHAVSHPEAVREPIRHRLEPLAGNVSAGLIIWHDLAVYEGQPYLEATRTVDRAAVQFIADRPALYLKSVAEAVAEFLAPTLRLFPGDSNVVRTYAPWIWRAIVALEALLLYGGMTVFLLRVPPAVKAAAAAYVLSSIAVALTAHTENRRFAMPVEPLAMMAGVVALAQIHPRHRYTAIATYS